MAKVEPNNRGDSESLNIDFIRSLVKQYSELGQWNSALFWADAAAAAGSSDGPPSGDDVWLLASAMLARGELHRAAHTVTSRGLHRFNKTINDILFILRASKRMINEACGEPDLTSARHTKTQPLIMYNKKKRHLLCLGVTMRAYLQAREPATALQLMDECDPMLLEPHHTDQTHNRALGGVLVWQARALTQLERREAAAEALAAALRADCASYEALELLLEHHALTPTQESELIDSLPINSQLSAAEGALIRSAYCERLRRYTPADMDNDAQESAVDVSRVRSRMGQASECRARRLAAACEWAAALKALEHDPWSCPEVRTACLVELRRSAELFAYAHTLVDAYPHEWSSWYAVGCYYYLIGKSEFARRYLSKAKSLEPSAGCVWLAYGHSFATENEHDQAMAAYFKASQLMAGCHLPPLYVAVECALLNNFTMCEKFLARAATIHSNDSVGDGGAEGEGEGEEEDECPQLTEYWRGVCKARCAVIWHEAGAAARGAGRVRAAAAAWSRALMLLPSPPPARFAATLDALGHARRTLGEPARALQHHRAALRLRPARSSTYTAMGLCLAMMRRERDAADCLHTALAKDPDDVVALALLDAIVDRLDATLTEEEIPQFPFPVVSLPPPPAAAPPTPQRDVTNTSDMSMSFD